MKTASRYADLPKDYAGLVAILPPRPIHTEDEYDQVQDMLDALTGFDLRGDQADYLEAITMFFAAYEQQHYAIDPLEGDPFSTDIDVDASRR